MKHSLMYISLHLIRFHEIHIKYVKRKTFTIKKKGIQRKPEACNFIKKETLAQAFSCEFCEISKNTFLTEHLWTTASAG